MRKKVLLSSLIFFMFFAGAARVIAHENEGFWHDDGVPAVHENWMGDMNLPDSLRLSELSLPGTHDTGTYPDHLDSVGDVPVPEYGKCQTMGLRNQLAAGIRAWDIRLKRDDDDDKLHFQHWKLKFPGTFEDNVVPRAVEFLSEHPAEVIVMRIKPENYDEVPPHFDDRVWNVLSQYSDFVYRIDLLNPEIEDPYNPPLKEIRGKIVIFADYVQSGSPKFIPWGLKDPGSGMDVHMIQDEWNLVTELDLDNKWGFVKQHLKDANTFSSSGELDKTYINFTSAVGVLSGVPTVSPYFYASGHIADYTDAPRKGTLLYRCDGCLLDTAREAGYEERECGGDSGPYEFPPHDEEDEWAYVLYEGINTLTMRYLRDCWKTAHQRAGIVYFNFPGAGAIESVINLNPLNWPPVANAGGPYAAGEGSTIQFSAEGSTDPDGDPLEYRWDLDGDGEWDTDWSSSPLTSQTFMDDFTGSAVVEVRDGYGSSATASATVTISNVPPTATPILFVQPNASFILPLVHTLSFSASSQDPGSDDATYPWNFGDGTEVTNIYYNNGVSADPYPSPDGDPMVSSDSVTHIYGAAGDYTVALPVSDDDGGVAAKTYNVHVADAAEALDITGTNIQSLPSAAFKGPADARKTAFAMMFRALDQMLAQRAYSGMILMLRENLRKATDGSLGGVVRDDWIVDPVTQRVLCQDIDDIIAYLASQAHASSAW